MEHGYASDQDTTIGPRLLGYRCNGLATALFLGELLDHLANVRGALDSDFSYFADGGGLVPLEEPSTDVGRSAQP